MTKTIELEFVSSTADVYKTGIKELYIPAYLGKAGVLENHLPYLTLLKPGEIYYQDTNGKNHYLYISDGFLEVQDNKITLISDSIEKGEEMDRTQIETKLKEINDTIKASLTLAGGISPEKLDKALLEQKVFKTKLEILDKTIQ